MNIGETVYREVAKRAEQGVRVTEVLLPPRLFEEWVLEGHNLNSLFERIGVKVREGHGTEPIFTEGVSK